MVQNSPVVKESRNLKPSGLKPYGAKHPSHSAVHMTEIILPQHTNALGTVFGGVIMSWIDICAAIAAQRHSGRIAVTASIDELHFLRPLKTGFIANLDSRVTAVHNTSCEVMVTVHGENPLSGSKFLTAEAFLTFVALDDAGKPVSMPALLAKTAEEKKLQQDGEIRRTHRLKLYQKLKKKKS